MTDIPTMSSYTAADTASPPPALTYEGPSEVLINQAILLSGTYDPLRIAKVSLVAEDKFPLGVTLNTDQQQWESNLPRGFTSAGVRWLRLRGTDSQGKVAGEQIIYITVSSDPMTAGQDLQLKVLQETLFKTAPVDSSNLKPEQKVTVKAGQTFTVTKYGYVDGHLKLTLEPPIAPIGDFGYFYEPFVQLSKGPQILRFDIGDIPNTPLKANILITTTTWIKAKAADSSTLPNNQKTQLLQGQTFGITGYASLAGHFRVTLSEDIPGFGRTGFIYWQHMQIKKDGKVIPYDPDATTLSVLKTTVFKKRLADSSTLKPEEKYTLNAGNVYQITGYALAGGDHIKVSLTDNLPGFGNTGYLYGDFVQLKRGGRTFNPMPPQVELNVPHFSQRDNPRLYWSTCNVTAIAMVMYYYGIRARGGGQLEDELLQWCLNKYGEGSQTDNAVLSELIKAYGFKTSFSTTRRWAEVKNELASGRPVVLGGLFTHGGHIVTVIGFSPVGYIVNDPWGDALTGYANTEGRKRTYPYSYMNQVAGPDGGVWAHIISK